MSLDIYLYKDGQEVHWGNITHNLNTMANEAGIYPALWRPEEIGAVKASDLVDILMTGLHALVDRPSYFKGFNATNGWGRYEHLVEFVSNYLEACVAHPDATIKVSR